MSFSCSVVCPSLSLHAPRSFLLLSLPRDTLAAVMFCYFVCPHSSCGSLSLTVVKPSPLWILFQMHYLISFPVSLSCSLVLIFLQGGSILRHWHADYIMDPRADQWPLNIKGGLAWSLARHGPSWP